MPGVRGELGDWNLRNVVVQGIVMVMDDQQLQQRSRSLHDALDRLSAARDMRGGTIPVVDLRDGDEPETTRTGRRRGLFRFAERARDAVRPRDRG
jgi:hypothetical protein